MKGEKIYALGKESEPARSNVPVSFVHTAPRLSFDGKWRAEFWYFVQTPKGKTISISAPRLRLTIELESQKLISQKLLVTGSRETLGTAPELTSAELCAAKDNYLNLCEYVTDTKPDKETLIKLDNLWKKTLPNALIMWLDDRSYLERKLQ